MTPPSARSAETPAGPSAWRIAVRAVLLVALAAIGLAALAGWAGRWAWWLDLFSHFRLQSLASLIVLMLLFLWQRMWRATLACGLLGGVLALGCAAYYFPPPPAPKATPTTRLLSFNVHTSNLRKADVLALIRASRADVVALYEIDEAWADALRVLDAEYPHRVMRARQDNFGIAVWSRWPLQAVKIVANGSSALPSIEAEVQAPGGAFYLIATHPPPPVSTRLATMRDAQLRALAENVKTLRRDDLVVAGDFNATPWSHAMRPLTEAGLRDARRGFGLRTTWMRAQPWISIPIDHVLIGPGLQAVSWEDLPATGSDHQPLLVTLQRGGSQ